MNKLGLRLGVQLVGLGVNSLRNRQSLLHHFRLRPNRNVAIRHHLLHINNRVYGFRPNRRVVNNDSVVGFLNRLLRIPQLVVVRDSYWNGCGLLLRLKAGV